MTKEEVEQKYKAFVEAMKKYTEENTPPEDHVWSIMGDGKVHLVYVDKDTERV